MDTKRVKKTDKVFEIKLMMEFPKETFIKGATKEAYMRILRTGSTTEDRKIVIFTDNKLFQEKFGPHLARGGVPVINLNIRMYYYLHFFCKKDVEKFIQEKLQKRNAFAKDMKSYEKRWNLNYDNLLPLFYPALTWYQEEAQEKNFSETLKKQLQETKKELEEMNTEDCFIETKYWRGTNFYIGPFP